MSGGWIAAMLVVGLLAIAAAVPLGAALLRLAVRWIAGFTPGFGHACGAVVVAAGLCWVGNMALAGALVGFDRRFGGLDVTEGAGLWAYLAAVLVLDVGMHALAVGAMVRRPEGARLEHGFALRVAATYLMMVFGTIMAVAGLLAALVAVRA